MECEAIDRARCHFGIDENKLQKYFHIMKKKENLYISSPVSSVLAAMSNSS